MNEIEIYQSGDGVQIEVRFDGDTVWANQKQIAQIFQTTVQNITIHLKKVYSDGEIEQSSTCKEYLQVQKEGKRDVERKQLFYNLDAILSVGYRVNSKRGTQFRQWATQRLKDYLVKGYAINQKRLSENLHHLEQAVKLIQSSRNDETLKLNEAKGLLDILGQYTQSFILLNQYDSHSLQTHHLNEKYPLSIKA